MPFKLGKLPARANSMSFKLPAYLEIAKGNLAQHLSACYLFGAVGIGIKFPSSAMKQFDAGKPWDVVKGSRLDGGHYVPLVGMKDGYLQVVTWGRVHSMTPAFFKKYNDESICYLTDEDLVAGKTPEGFDVAELRADLAALK